MILPQVAREVEKSGGRQLRQGLHCFLFGKRVQRLADGAEALFAKRLQRRETVHVFQIARVILIGQHPFDIALDLGALVG